jgi:hypothetical protein
MVLVVDFIMTACEPLALVITPMVRERDLIGSAAAAAPPRFVDRVNCP